MKHRTPRFGDVLLRGDGYAGFELVRAVTHEEIQTKIPSLEAAVEVARAHGAGAIWQQSFDNRGRPLGDPVRLFHLTTRDLDPVERRNPTKRGENRTDREQ